MLKPLTLSLGLAVVFGMSNLSMAGGHHASPQGPSPQGVIPSAQSDLGCGDVCAPAKKSCGLFDLFKPKPKCYTYEWVLKKKRVRHSLFGGHGGGLCGDSCGEVVLPSGQGPSPQAIPTAQAYSYGSAQYAAPAPIATGQIGGGGAAQDEGTTRSPAPASDEPPAMPNKPADEGNNADAAAADAGGLLFLSPAGN